MHLTLAIHYVSEDEFEPEFQAEIYRRAEELAERYDWWNEPLWFYESTLKPFHLTGSTELTRNNPVDENGLPILGSEIAPRDNSLLAYIDLQRLVGLLEILSSEFQVHWTLFRPDAFETFHLGAISDGAADSILNGKLAEEVKAWAFTEQELADTDLHEQLKAKYAHTQAGPYIEPIDETLPPEREIS